MNAFGRILGEEEWGKGTNVALGPTIDVVRVPEWGRAFNTYGEDPYLNSRMAAAEIRGIQSQGPIADANMYLTMNQETNRFRQDSVVNERTLQEIYLPPFQAAIQQGHVGTIICAYVKTSGVYSCENPELLTTFLRKELGIEGWVMSDWGATHSTVAAATAGLD
jgi:beta-glucosidase